MNLNIISKRALALAMVALALATAAAGRANLPLPPAEEVSSITTRDLKKHLSFLASDELGGRYTLSNRIAARYLASQLESYGYRGAARDKSFFQNVPLQFTTPDFASSRVKLSLADEKLEYKYGEGFVTNVATTADLSGGLVFAGYGISSPKNNYDDYAGLNAKGKIVVIIEGMPEKLKNVRIADEEKEANAALAHGAIAMMVVRLETQTGEWYQIRTNFSRTEQLGLPPRPTKSGVILPSIAPGPSMIKAIAKAMGKDSSYLLTPRSELQPATINATAEIKLKFEIKQAPPAQNVVGILDGSDPKLKDQYIVISAHYDHLPTSESGEVYNGADDDGSGTVAVLEIAQAFATGARSKRSILIVFHTGEELGLFGSEFNTDYEPVVPLEKLVADFNIDMIGRSRPPGDEDSRDRALTDKDSIYIIGADKHSTELNRLNEETNREMARLRFDYTYNDENHPENFYGRSDHYNYAKHGIPIIFYFTGVHRDYHKTTDDVDKIDFQKMERIGRMIFSVSWRVANLDHRLVVDKKPSSAANAQ